MGEQRDSVWCFVAENRNMQRWNIFTLLSGLGFPKPEGIVEGQTTMVLLRFPL